jgi:hypothetical protein
MLKGETLIDFWPLAAACQKVKTTARIVKLFKSQKSNTCASSFFATEKSLASLGNLDEYTIYVFLNVEILF